MRSLKEYFTPDQLELLEILVDREVDFLIVGGTAVAYHGYPRNTKDLDIYVSNREENVEKLFHAIDEFFGGVHPEIGEYEEFVGSEKILQFGKGKNRTEILFDIDSVVFEKAIDNSEDLEVNGIHLPIIGYDDLLTNKEATGRDRDRADIEQLKKIYEQDGLGDEEK